METTELAITENDAEQRNGYPQGKTKTPIS
jgi:hypothetical protein